MHRLFASIVLFCASFVLAPLATAAITIDTVPVGNAGNAGDTTVMQGFDHTTGYGSVVYDYRIGTTEVTVGQYTVFLNAVAVTDSYALYNPLMATDLRIAGIAQSGFSGSFSYSVIGSPNHPVTYVGWGDATRFSNWLHNGQPTGPQNASTTEGGAYTLNGATSDAALAAVSRNVGAQWFIPTENEWYKAAYHKNDGVTGNYFAYPTSSDTVPTTETPPGGNNSANYSAVSLPDVGNPTDVGAYTISDSPYGTFDQGGNVYEWNEALIEGSYRGVRGGSWFNISNDLLSSARYPHNFPTVENWGFGFRVATVPEPGFGWNNPSGGQFDIGANWVYGTTPTPLQSAVFNLAETYTVTFAGSETNDRLFIRQGNVTFDLGGSTYSLTSNSADSVAIADQAGNVASLTLTNGTLSAIGTMQVGGGTGHLTVNTGGVVNVGGTLTATSGGAVTLSGGTLNVTSIMIPGVTLTGFGTLNGIVTGSGTVTANGGTLTLGDPANVAGVSLTGTLNVGANAHAVLLNSDRTNLGATTTLAHGAELTAANGLALGASKALTATGSATVNGAFANGGIINGPVAAGTLLSFADDVDGAGLFTGNIQFAGEFSPGTSPATISIAGNVTFAPTATLRVEIGGTTAGSLDQVVVSGQATLGGTLDVDLINGFQPALGGTVTVMTFLSRSGNFATYTDTLLAGHLALTPLFTPNSLVLKAIPAVDGDINLDGTVNIFDINAVSSLWGTSDPLGDANADGSVNIFDINLISTSWTPTGGAGSVAAVPEPATWLMILPAAAACMLARIRRLQKS